MSLTVDPKKMLELESLIFQKSGLKKEEADTVADNLVQAEMRGIHSHGLIQTENYSKLMRAKKINPHSQIKIVQDGPGTTVFDADHAPGSVAGKIAMAKTIEKAKKNGVAITTVRNATHFGFAAYYAMDALPENMIGMAFTSTGLAVAPFGGYDKVLGTNPICVAVPAGKKRPIVFDAATSNVAFNKIFFAYTEGKSIPDDWALTKDGKTTTNPADVITGGGPQLPFGGYKGYGLDLIVFIMTTLLSGTSVLDGQGDTTAECTDKIGYNFAAIDISRFTNIENFKQNIDITIERIKNSQKREGVQEIFVPGEIEYNNHERQTKEGLFISDGIAGKIRSALEQTGITAKLEDIAI